MVGFENYVKAIMSCLSKLKVLLSFYFPNAIPDNPTVTKQYVNNLRKH